MPSVARRGGRAPSGEEVSCIPAALLGGGMITLSIDVDDAVGGVDIGRDDFRVQLSQCRRRAADNLHRGALNGGGFERLAMPTADDITSPGRT